MARLKIPSEAVRARFALAGRIAALRSEMFGERGGAEMARRLGLPLRTWYNYEEGTAIPAEVSPDHHGADIGGAEVAIVRNGSEVSPEEGREGRREKSDQTRSLRASESGT